MLFHILLEQEKEVDSLKNRPLERIFKNNIARILDFFIINQEFNFTSNELSDLSEVPLRTVQRIIPQLIEKKLIKVNEKSKKNKLYELNKDSELVEILNNYSTATINNFIKEAHNQQKQKILIIQKNNKSIKDFGNTE